MLLPLVIFPALLVIGLSMGGLRWIQAGVHLGILFIAFALCFFLQWPMVIVCIAAALLDVILILTIFQGDISIR